MITKVFSQVGDFEAKQAAEQWCEESGIAVGRMQHNAPRGLMWGLHYDIQKWRNLRERDIAALHGRMTGEMRNGPVSIEIDETKKPA